MPPRVGQPCKDTYQQITNISEWRPEGINDIATVTPVWIVYEQTELSLFKKNWAVRIHSGLKVVIQLILP